MKRVPIPSPRHDATAQERLLPFLLRRGSYPHRPRSVRLIQTHSAFVFIAPPFVYKVKKAVNFGFLDFSTLERRHQDCDRELRLNQRLTEGIYLDVVPIREGPDGVHFGGEGRVIEFTLRMRELSREGFLDQRLERHAVSGRDLDRVTDRLAAFYLAQHPSPAIAAAGRIPRLQTATRENTRQTRAFLGATLTPATDAAIRAFTRTGYSTLAPVFESRVRENRILDCHGDLHLEHIHLTPGALNIFDCIEFNERFRHVDVANDVAFLAMDLDFHGRPDLATRVTGRLARRLKDPGLLRLLDFYKCYRAVVRGKVESLHSVAHAAGPAERAASARTAKRYFRLALQYAVAGSRPLVLAVMGPPGSGKSTIAGALARELGWDALSSDRVRKESSGVPLHSRGDAESRQRLYTAARTRATYRILHSAARSAAAAGKSFLVDATFSDPGERAALRDACRRAGADCCFVELHAGTRVLAQRLRQREGTTAEVSDARLEDLPTLMRRYTSPDELPESERLRIASGPDPESTVSRVLVALARRQAAAGAAVPGPIRR